MYKFIDWEIDNNSETLLLLLLALLVALGYNMLG
jgi:hypothetical protein